MRVGIAGLRGTWRLMRGRCPQCHSENVDGCGVCRGYRGPYPASAETLRRWRWRHEDVSARAERASYPVIAEPAQRSS
jgi:hypothetical protein